MSSFSNNLISGASNAVVTNAPIPEPLFSTVSSDNEIAQVECVFMEDQVALAKLTMDTQTRAQWLANMKAEWELQKNEKEQLNVERDTWGAEGGR